MKDLAHICTACPDYPWWNPDDIMFTDTHGHLPSEKVSKVEKTKEKKQRITTSTLSKCTYKMF